MLVVLHASGMRRLSSLYPISDVPPSRKGVASKTPVSLYRIALQPQIAFATHSPLPSSLATFHYAKP